MAPVPSALLALASLAALCLRSRTRGLQGALAKPSIWAEPSPVVPRGRPVTIVCQGAAGFELFRLERSGTLEYTEKKNSLTDETQARFPIPAVNDHTAGRYQCIYKKVEWSVYSDPLELLVSSEEPAPTPGPTSALPPDTSSPGSTQLAANNGTMTARLYIFISVSVAILLCPFLLFYLHRQRQLKQEPPSSEGQGQRPQERLGLAVHSPERPAGDSDPKPRAPAPQDTAGRPGKAHVERRPPALLETRAGLQASGPYPGAVSPARAPRPPAPCKDCAAATPDPGCAPRPRSTSLTVPRDLATAANVIARGPAASDSARAPTPAHPATPFEALVNGP